MATVVVGRRAALLHRLRHARHSAFVPAGSCLAAHREQRPYRLRRPMPGRLACFVSGAAATGTRVVVPGRAVRRWAVAVGWQATMWPGVFGRVKVEGGLRLE